MSDRANARRWIVRGSLLLGLAGAATPVRSQSTEAQREHVKVLEQDWRARLAGRVRAPSNISPRATDTTHAGALIVVSEPELTGLARQTAPRAWEILVDNFGEGARALESINTIVMLQHLTGQTLEIVRIIKEPDGSDVRTRSGSVPADPAQLSLRIAQEAGAVVAMMFDVPWSVFTSIVPENDRSPIADAFMQIATARDLSTRDCARGDHTACHHLLGLDRTEIPADDVDMQGPAQTISTLRARMTALALRHGGPTAAVRFRSSTSRDLGERFSAAAGMPIDSLLTLWHREVTRPRAGLLNSRALLSVLGFTFVMLAISLRRPVRR